METNTWRFNTSAGIALAAIGGFIGWAIIARGIFALIGALS